MNSDDSQLDRYRRQTRFAPLGEQGQRRLMAARVLIVGCGALGTVIANTLVRAGVGLVRIVDRDFVETGNLHRQVLFDQSDAAAQLPKAIAAANHLLAINSQVTVEPIVADVNPTNIRQLASGVDLLLDGTDNFETRYLMNDYAVESGTPWIFGGCVGAEGQTLTVLPGETPCLACVIPEPPSAAVMPTCETVGVLGPIVNVVASLQSIEAIKLLAGERDQLNRGLTVIDLWHNQIRTIGFGASARQNDCPTCQRNEFPWLGGERGASAVLLCGRNAVQILPAAAEPVSLEEMANKLQPLGDVQSNPYLVRLAVEGYLLTVFADGRTIVGGTDDLAVARTVHAKYIGG